MKITLLPFSEDIFPIEAKNTNRDRELAILITLHDRHIGITPDLVKELSPVLLEGKCPPSGFGRQLCDRLSDVLKTEKGGSKPDKIAEFIVNAPEYTILRIVSPLVFEACQQIGEAQLFCDRTDLENDAVTKDYHPKLSRRLAEFCKISTLLDSNTKLDSPRNETKPSPDKWELFWQEAAYMLRAINQGQLITTEKECKNKMPVVNPVTAAFLFRLNEKPKPKNEEVFRRLHTLTAPVQDRKEGGIQNIRVARELDDIGDMLYSEWMNPPVLWQDRVVNTGYLAIEREPKQEKLRDVLFIGTMPYITRQQTSVEYLNQDQSELSTEFVKICWFNFAVYMGQQLRKYGLVNSEFRWIEEDKWGRIRIESHLLPDIEFKFHMSQVQNLNLGDRETDWVETRKEFLNKLRWLPNFIDVHTRYKNDFSSNLSEQEITKKIIEKLTVTHRIQEENPHWDNLSNRRQPFTSAPKAKGNKLALNDFLFVHEMIFMPTLIEGKEQSADQRRRWNGKLVAATNLTRNERRHNLNITWIPPTILPIKKMAEDEPGFPEWALTAPQYRTRENLIPKTNRDINEVANKLVEAWLTELIREIKHAS